MTLKDVVEKRIIDNVFKPLHKVGEWKVLVVDHLSMRMVSSCLKMHDLLEVGITIVENVHIQREPLNRLEAIYLITPDEKVLEEVIEDFDSFFLTYKSAHIFFTEVCPDHLMTKLHQIRKFVKTLKEIDIAFLPCEEQVFSLDNPSTFDRFFSPAVQNQEHVEHMEKIAEQLATLCASLGEFPSIRYKPDNPKMVGFANQVKARLDVYKRDDPSIGEGRYPAQLILLDRGFDPISPLLHELTYQAMAYDLINIKNDVFKYKVEDEDKEALLDENDEMWVKLRHLHIADVSRKIPEEIKEFSEKEKLPSSQNKMKDLQAMLKKAPQYKDQVKKFMVHFSLAEECMRHYNEVANKLCPVEQELATGFDKDDVKLKEPVKGIVPVLLDHDIRLHDKLKVILLYILFKHEGISEENLDKLCGHAQIPVEDRAEIMNMEYLGIPVIKGSIQKKYSPVRKTRMETFYLLSRWVPYIKDIIEDAIEGTLSEQLFPFLVKRALPVAGGYATGFPATSARRAKAAKSDKTAAPVSLVPRLIVFIVGGVTYSETRSAYEVSRASAGRQEWEVLIGSDQITTPQAYLDKLRNLPTSP
ncbi:syntaxin-binding protein 1 [Nematostella vectensis]|uniref:syntaxin-binding protein 1 n=1 Tax=Nematostella vectensis TaxID=45351 RepID=UPI00207713CA|nr:syntaxin-binding protein 1 [Nematostella vectensis]